MVRTLCHLGNRYSPCPVIQDRIRLVDGKLVAEGVLGIFKNSAIGGSYQKWPILPAGMLRVHHELPHLSRTEPTPG